MASRGIAASFTMKSGKKCSIENDGIVTLETLVRNKPGKYENVRVVGMDRAGEAIRVVMSTGGITEIPCSTITDVTDISKDTTGFPCVTIK